MMGKKEYKTADEMKKNIEIPNPVPPGNKVAHYIRAIHENSHGMFPSTAGSKRSYDKYNTVTHLSFCGPDGFEIQPGELGADFPRKKETIEDIMLSPRKNQMFNRWSVPNRLLDSTNGAIPDTIPEELNADDVSVSVRSDVSHRSKKSTPPPPSRVARQMSLPNIPLSKSATPRMESRNGLQATSPCRTPRSAPRAPVRSQTLVVDTKPGQVTRTDSNGLPLRTALKPEAVPQAEAWMKKANSAEKKVIERVLKMASRKNEVERSLRQTLLPDAKSSVEKWLNEASEGDRQVALNFFNSLAGGQLMGMTVNTQRQRLKDVINTLEEGKPKAPPRGGAGRRPQEVISDGKLRYLRLLTPNTRENRWMHTTWHHLPQYNNNNVVENISSHYIRPHGQISRHFVIHPDWG